MTNEDLLKLNKECGESFEKLYLETMRSDPSRELEWYMRRARVMEVSVDQLKKLADLRGLSHAKAMNFQKTDKYYLAELDQYNHDFMIASRKETIAINHELLELPILTNDDVVRISEKYSVTDRRVRNLYEKIELARKNNTLKLIDGYKEYRGGSISPKVITFAIALTIALSIWWYFDNRPDNRSKIERGADQLCQTIKCV